jgi:serine/threonine protein kinase
MPDSIILNDRYQLEESSGTGGMAVVYRARDLMLERYVAIKILRESFTGDPEFRERFRQEARAAANLSHPNIVTVHDFGLDRNRLFIVMEYIPGTHLKNVLKRRGRLPEDEALSLIVQACAGVGYAHRAGLVHCDIKPHNFLITPDNRVKVTDFGIARALASIEPEERAEIVWGSPQYFSPEQASGNAPSPASDVYSLGVILYEMLTGRLPFDADAATELARLHRETPPPSPRQFNPQISPTVEQILFKVLAKEPSARYRTADQLGRVLINFQRSPQLKTITMGNAATKAISQSGTADYNAQVPTITSPSNHQSRPIHQEQPIAGTSSYTEEPTEVDWITISLALLAILALGGLVPLYLWVYFLYFP